MCKFVCDVSVSLVQGVCDTHLCQGPTQTPQLRQRLIQTPLLCIWGSRTTPAQHRQ